MFTRTLFHSVKKTMEVTLSLLYIFISLFVVITLTVVNCASEEDEDDNRGKKKSGAVLKASKDPAKQKRQSKVALAAPRGKIPPKESVTKKLPPTAPQTVSNTSLHSQKKVQSKVSHSKSTTAKGKVAVQPCQATEAKTVTVCKSTTFKEEPKTKTGTKPKFPAIPEELGPVLVDQKLYDKLKKRYDLSNAPPSNQGGMSNILNNEGATGSGAASHISHYKTQSFAGSGSLSKLSTKVDHQSAVDGAKREVKEKIAAMKQQ